MQVGRERFVIPLDAWRSADDYAELEVSATVDLGWTVLVLDTTAPETALPLVTSVEPAAIPELSLVLTRDASVPNASPGLLRVRVDFHDRDGAVGDSSVMLHFADAGQTLVPIELEDYLYTLPDISSDDETLSSSTIGAASTDAMNDATMEGGFATLSLDPVRVFGSVAFWTRGPGTIGPARTFQRAMRR